MSILSLTKVCSSSLGKESTLPNYRRQRSLVETFELQYMLRVRVSRIEAETFALSKPRPLCQMEQQGEIVIISQLASLGITLKKVFLCYAAALGSRPKFALVVRSSDTLLQLTLYYSGELMLLEPRSSVAVAGLLNGRDHQSDRPVFSTGFCFPSYFSLRIHSSIVRSRSGRILSKVS
jgi:hypothetical protein